MKLFRFISNNEYTRLMSGETIVNTTDYSKKYDTNSKGFCFFAYNRTNNIDLIISNVLDEWGFAGIVNNSYLQKGHAYRFISDLDICDFCPEQTLSLLRANSEFTPTKR